VRTIVVVIPGRVRQPFGAIKLSIRRRGRSYRLGAEAFATGASLPTRAASASSKSPLERDQHLKALRSPRVRRYDRRRVPDALALGSFAIAHPRLANGDRPDAGHDLALRRMTMGPVAPPSPGAPVEFAIDSPLEGNGFELPVPLTR
jgi:hypothetical protein